LFFVLPLGAAEEESENDSSGGSGGATGASWATGESEEADDDEEEVEDAAIVDKGCWGVTREPQEIPPSVVINRSIFVMCCLLCVSWRAKNKRNKAFRNV
jgi:hypothetical protein